VANDLGAGIYCKQADPTFTDCTISNNNATFKGGAIYALEASPSFTRCALTDNGAIYGAGIFCEDGGPPTFTNCVISGNAATQDAGGVHCYQCSPRLANSIITRNSAGAAGGGVFCGDGSMPILTNCTFSGNTAGTTGGGVHCNHGSNPSLANCILWGDLPHEIYVYTGIPSVVNCDVQNGTGASWFTTGAGNIDADPLFVDPDGPDDDPNTYTDNDLRLDAGSPCIDAGYNDGVPQDTADLDLDSDTAEPLPLDLDEHPRFVQDPDVPDTGEGNPPLVDLGAYEACSDDADGDGVLDCADGCPNDPDKNEPGTCGCGTPDTDSDNDGVLDCDDGCPNDPAKIAPGACGCGVPEGTCGGAPPIVIPSTGGPSEDENDENSELDTVSDEPGQDSGTTPGATAPMAPPGSVCPAVGALMFGLTLVGLARTRHSRRLAKTKRDGKSGQRAPNNADSLAAK
jgi:predicted outer membrane repeat protein